jgi:hypothetical protein
MAAKLDNWSVSTIIWEPRMSLEEVLTQIPKNRFPGLYTGLDKEAGG